MIVVEKVLISDEIAEAQFVCDLTKCKGGCCEEGDAGAPLEDAELDIMVDLFEKVKPYLTPAAIAEIERKGKYVYHKEFGWVTPTLGGDNEICVYGSRDEKGVIKCAFEQAYNDGVINWKKPISCHLYPIRITKYPEFDVLNYDRWSICSPACSFGNELKVHVHEFLKAPLIRKYGADWYTELEEAVDYINTSEI